MDRATYNFSRNTIYKETAKNNVPEEIKEIVNFIKNKGLKINNIYNPQVDIDKQVMEGSYVVEFFYDFGEETRKFLLVKILKNKWTNWVIEWWIRLDEIGFKKIKGNDFEELKKTIEIMLIQNK